MILRFLFAAVVAAAVTLAPAVARAKNFAGTFALQAGVQRSVGHLDATYLGRHAAVLDVWVSRSASSPPLRDYDVEMTKVIHLIAVGSDFASFQHVHPALGADGHFRIVLRVPSDGTYHIYADLVPRGLGQQVFRFDVPFGRARLRAPSAAVPGMTARAGPYEVTLSGALRSGVVVPLRVDVTRNGAPARDLRSYLGALAHAVFIAEGDLAYVHVHASPVRAGAMSGMAAMPGMSGGAMRDEAELAPGAAVPAHMLLYVALKKAGTYRLWFEFRGGTGVVVAPFVLAAN